MKLYLLAFALLVLLNGCSSYAVKVDQDELNKIKKVAVVIFALRKSIEHRDTPYEDDSDLAAAAANATLAGNGSLAAERAFPAFIEELNRLTKSRSIHILSLKEMRANPKFMALYTPPSEEGEDNMLTSFFSASAYARSPRGIMNFGMPDEFDQEDGSALTGKDEETRYIKQAIEALNVDAALIIVDRGTSFQCNVACVMGTGDASLGAAFHSILISRSGKIIAKINHTFEGDAHALMYRYSITLSSQREKLYIAHGKKMAQEYMTLFDGKKE